MDPCLGKQAIQDRKRGDNQVKRSVKISLRVTDGEGVRTRGVTGKIHKSVEQWYGDK